MTDHAQNPRTGSHPRSSTPIDPVPPSVAIIAFRRWLHGLTTGTPEL